MITARPRHWFRRRLAGTERFRFNSAMATDAARVVIIGNAAGGKSTLARTLAARRDLPLVEMDRLLWRKGWQLAPADVYPGGMLRQSPPSDG
jgi:hypothetical protein